MHITFRQLETFTEVVRQGSMQDAAKILNVTQPAVSMHIKELEGQVGHRLFDRAKRRLSLTTAGEHLLFQARKLLANLKETEDAMARFSRLESGRLTIGMVSAAKYFLPHLLAQFNAEHPAIEVRLRLGIRDVLGAMLDAREVDLCIMGRAPREIECRAEPFAQHPHVLVTAPAIASPAPKRSRRPRSRTSLSSYARPIRAPGPCSRNTSTSTAFSRSS